jgi:hypothetical protein
MAFDPSTAKPLPGGFDPTTAKPEAEKETAAFGIYPKQRATPSKPETQQAMRTFAEKTGQALGFGVPEEPEMSPGAVAGGAGFGAAAGALGPSALKRGGQLISKIPTPQTRAAGGLMQALGTGMQSIPTTRRAAATGAAVGGAELAGQLGEQVGIPRAVSTPAVFAMPSATKAAGRALLGAPTRTREQYARAAESLGFQLSPAQVRADVPIPAKGSAFITSSAPKNQALANKLASSSTGAEAKEISPDFVRKRIKDLGAEFDSLYKGKSFNIDQDAIQAIQSIAANEMQLPANASVTAVKQTADNIIKNYISMASRTGAKPSTFSIDGDALQRLRTDLLGAARSATQRQDAHQIYELVDVIDGSIARNHPQIAAKLDIIRPQYRNTVILEDLIRSGGIKGGDISLERLGNLVMGRKGGVRSQRDLDQLGELGRELQLRARWEKEGAGATPGEGFLSELLGTTADITGRITGTRSGAARAAQRYLGE